MRPKRDLPRFSRDRDETIKIGIETETSSLQLESANHIINKKNQIIYLRQVLFSEYILDLYFLYVCLCVCLLYVG